MLNTVGVLASLDCDVSTSFSHCTPSLLISESASYITQQTDNEMKGFHKSCS